MYARCYLSFNGQCEEAFKAYEKCLDGKIAAMMPYADMPGGHPVPEAMRSKIMHARITVGDTILMGSDAPPDRYSKPAGFSVIAGVDSAADAERIFRELSGGGSVQMALAETFFAVRFGTLTDRFGIPWMVICEKPM